MSKAFVLVDGHVRNEIPGRLEELLGTGYKLIPFMYDGGFEVHMATNGWDCDSSDAIWLASTEEIYQALYEKPYEDGVTEKVLNPEISIWTDGEEYKCLAGIWGYNEDGDDRYQV